MLVSVIIPTKNEETNISILLKQLRRQSFTDMEIIIADAQSTDRTREIALSLGAIVVEGGPVGIGRNRGALAAKGSMYIFMDADAVLPSKQFLKDVLEEMHVQQLDVAGLQVMPVNGTWMDRLTYGFYNRYTLLVGNYLPHAVGTCMIAKRFVHEAIGGFDETITLAEDMHYARLGSAVGNFGILRSHAIYTPMRRWRKDGRLLLTWRYIYSEFHMIFKGPIRGNVPYDFDYSKDTDAQS